ncbi:hypothetical protein C0583_02540 [Candidatus Parcubacteria bacterium]|nr:MAG: hypothetical protein C0583_02540 [Candidatus Parcubacteria bacterium]
MLVSSIFFAIFLCVGVQAQSTESLPDLTIDNVEKILEDSSFSDKQSLYFKVYIKNLSEISVDSDFSVCVTTEPTAEYWGGFKSCSSFYVENSGVSMEKDKLYTVTLSGSYIFSNDSSIDETFTFRVDNNIINEAKSNTIEELNEENNTYKMQVKIGDGEPLSVPVCSDSDNGLNYDEYGVVLMGEREYNDACALSEDGVIKELVDKCYGINCLVKETVCDNNIPRSKYWHCAYGCNMGECIQDADSEIKDFEAINGESECVDSDKGTNVYKFGRVTINFDNNLRHYNDVCVFSGKNSSGGYSFEKDGKFYTSYKEIFGETGSNTCEGEDCYVLEGSCNINDIDEYTGSDEIFSLIKCVDGCSEGVCKKTQDIIDIELSASRLHSQKLDEILLELHESQDETREQEARIKYLSNLTKDTNEVSENMQNALNNFITYGVDENTKQLGECERAAVIYSYKSAFDKLPENEEELADAIKIANGRWPSITNEEAEKRAKEQFQKIYKRIADMNVASDNAAVTVMAYGLRQKAENRNLDSETQGIKTFRAIYGYNPSSTDDWNIMQAITYSGATRGTDTDGDLLIDEREDELGTDKNNPDTDGDGYGDGVEVANGYNPKSEGKME